jgi:hypothetical protein
MMLMQSILMVIMKQRHAYMLMTRVIYFITPPKYYIRNCEH